MTWNNKRAAVFPSKGIGDALLMMIASHQLKSQGYAVATCHEKIQGLQSWFPDHQFKKEIPLEELDSYDLVIVQNDNSEKMGLFRKHARSLSIFYPSYNLRKHPPLSSLDQVFSEDLPMAENIARACARLLQLDAPSKDNGLTPPKQLVHRKFAKRLVIHPTSSLEEKNWPAKKFIKLGLKLKEKGWDPVFITDDSSWEKVKEQGLLSERFESLDQVAAYIYESAFLIGNDSLLGHLASNLYIDHITIADSEKKMRLWRPGWHSGVVITPYSWIPNLKFLRLREKLWKHWIIVQRVSSQIKRI